MNRPTIVVIDDDKHAVELLLDYLDGQGFAVFHGYDGQSALPLAKRHTPALVILDVDMPIMNGLQALRLLREDKDTKHIPVIMLTGVASGKVYPVIENEPRVSHVKKPVRLDDLLSVIRLYIPPENSAEHSA